MFSAYTIGRLMGKRIVASIALCLMGVLLLTGCVAPHFRWAPRTTSSTTGGAKPTAQQLIASLQKNFRSVSAFHVAMQVDNPGPVAQGQVQIRSADGDVLMPDKVKALASVILSGQAVQVNLISVGSSQFITDPVTGQWRVVKGVLDPRTLTNPDTGLISLINKVQNISQPVSDNVNGTACWRITGQLDAKYIAFFTGGGVPAGTMLHTSACIGQNDALPYQVIITGQAAAGDTPQTTRTFVLSKYNESISINAPQI